MSKLQYTIEKAYSDNISVCKFKDGKQIDHDIIEWYALEGYVQYLENEGYERVYDTILYKQRWEEAKKLEKEAHTAYINALCHPLMRTDR